MNLAKKASNLKNKKILVLVAAALLVLAILAAVLLIFVGKSDGGSEDMPAAADPVPIVQVITSENYLSIANEVLLPLLEEKIGTSAEISLVLPDKASEGCALSLTFGNNATTPAQCFALHSEVGIDGYMINILDNTSATADFLSDEGARNAALALAACVVAGDTPSISNSGEAVSVSRGKGAELHRTVKVGSQSCSVLCVSAPDTDTNTMNALSSLIDASGADILVFNGDLDCGAKNRAELSAAWESINAILEQKAVSFIYTLSNEESLPHTMISEVVSSMDRCIGGGCGVYTVCRDDGEPLTSIITASHNSSDAADGVVAAVDELIPFWKNTTGKKFPLLAVFPDAPSDLYNTAASLSASGTLVPCTDTETNAILKAAFSAEADHIILGGSKNSRGVAPKLLDKLPEEYTSALSPMLALCGSIGFLQEGLGGRFELNHSLRGGVCFAATADSCAFSYLYALKYT